MVHVIGYGNRRLNAFYTIKQSPPQFMLRIVLLVVRVRYCVFSIGGSDEETRENEEHRAVV